MVRRGDHPWNRQDSGIDSIEDDKRPDGGRDADSQNSQGRPPSSPHDAGGHQEQVVSPGGVDDAAGGSNNSHSNGNGRMSGDDPENPANDGGGGDDLPQPTIRAEIVNMPPLPPPSKGGNLNIGGGGGGGGMGGMGGGPASGMIHKSSKPRDSITDGILNRSLNIRNIAGKNRGVNKASVIGGGGRSGGGGGGPDRGAGGTRSDAMTRVSGLLWDMGSVSDHSTLAAEARMSGGASVSMFDPDGLAAAREADEMEEREARWEEVGRTCGRICKVGLCLSILVGIAVASTAVAKQNQIAKKISEAQKSPDGGEGAEVELKGEALDFVSLGSFPDGANVADICSLSNISQDEGYEECRALCEKALCCIFEEWDPESCLKTKADECVPFIECCSVLTTKEEEAEEAV